MLITLHSIINRIETFISNASTPYRHSLTLRDMIEPEEAKPLFDKLFNTPCQLMDLAAIPDEKLRTELQGYVQAKALLLSLKHVFNKNLEEYFDKWLLTSYQALEQQGYIDEVADLIYYIYTEGNLSDSSRFWSYLHRKFSKEVEEKVMTLGHQAEQRAMQRRKSVEVRGRITFLTFSPTLYAGGDRFVISRFSIQVQV
jgi:Putative transposase, YhgA-like